jgi:hypothetical protein
MHSETDSIIYCCTSKRIINNSKDMKFIYSLFHYFIAYSILINMCLQSCTGFDNRIPTKQSIQPTQVVCPVAYDQALNAGLIAASNTDKAKGKGKLTEDEGQEESSNTAQLTTNASAGEIASEKNHGSINMLTLLHRTVLNGDFA